MLNHISWHVSFIIKMTAIDEALQMKNSRVLRLYNDSKFWESLNKMLRDLVHVKVDEKQ